MMKVGVLYMSCLTCAKGLMAAISAADGGTNHSDCGVVVSGSPFSSSGIPLPSLNKESTSSERGSPGRTHPRFVLSEFPEL